MKQIQDIKKNIEAEIGMISELADFVAKYQKASQQEKKLFADIVNSLRTRIKLINNSLPELLGEVSFTKKLPQQQKKEEASTEISIPSYEYNIVVKGRDKDIFLKELDISEGLIKKVKKRGKRKKKKSGGFKKPNPYGKVANSIFLETSEKAIKKGYFKSLSLDLRRSNSNILTTTYVSMMFLSVLLSVLLGIVFYVFFIFFNIGFDFPFFSLYEGNSIMRALRVSWLLIAVPALVGALFYFYPGAEKKSLAKLINQELPFVVIHMASISGSGIEPSEIFKIISTSKEYKHTNKEIKKIMNQINLHGYDLTNALRNVALTTPSTKLSELLNGISITINSGGDINSFFEKRAESLLLEYRLEREKATKAAETFMDIYISIVIAAPMILLMLLVMISVSGISTGFSVNQLTVGIIGLVAIINIIFLTFLHLKQPAL